MGVNGLWTVVQPCARPTNLATLNRKRLAVDASIWIYQFLKAVRDKEGNALRNSHVVGFFRRICKLLWFGILPVFVFDGGAPALKRATIQQRHRRREGRRDDAVKTAGKLLAVQMQRAAEEDKEKRKREKEKDAATVREEEMEEEIPDMSNVVYAGELGMSQHERQKTRSFRKQDQYHLPELDGGISNMGKPEDPRIMSVEELEEYARQFHNGEDVNLYDFSKIDFDGDFFKSLPAADRYNILNAGRLRSRLRMGLSKEQLDDMFPDRMAFSRFQIERVRERNNLTQRLMAEAGMTGTDLTLTGNARIAGEKDREYILVKNEGAEGGWALGVVSKEKDVGEAHKPIDVDAIQISYQSKDADEAEEEDDLFEDVPIEGVNRLPKPSFSAQDAREPTFDVASRRQALYTSRQDHPAHKQLAHEPIGDAEGSLFVGGNTGEEIEETVPDGMHPEEQDDIDRAIAMSLQKQHGINGEQEEYGEEAAGPAPQWTQKIAETARPIGGSGGSMIAHVVNNRANAAIPKPQAKPQPQPQPAEGDESDSEEDMQAIIAKSRKKRQQQPQPAFENKKNPFDGPLPFPKLDWKSSPFSKGKKYAPQKQSAANTGQEKFQEDGLPQDEMAGGFGTSAEADDMAGGFEKPTDDDGPAPLPPWMIDNTDIRENIQKQQEADRDMNAEDKAQAEEEQRLRRRAMRNERIEIESSDDEDEVEIVSKPPSPKKKSSPSLQSKSPDEVPAQIEDGQASPANIEEKEDSPEPEFEDVPVLEVTESAKAKSASASPEAELEFEDVLATGATNGEAKVDSPEPVFEDVPQGPTLVLQQDNGPSGIPTNAMADDSVTAQEQATAEDDDLFADLEYDEFSDPGDEELMAQMAGEAEEHARFASELNNKSAQQNREDYERELRQLRNQQKKDRRDADEVTQVMVTECQALLRLFGIPYITAPMEAEAECASLVKLGLVDGIVTDDSDTFLFGGTRVYKNMFNTNKFVECYIAGDLEKELSLSREQLISLAQLLGSDYTEGLAGVGPVTAVEILSEFPGKSGLEDFREWWLSVQSQQRPKEADAGSTFRRKFRKSQGTKLFLPTGFPNSAVFDAYLNPEVDSSTDPFQWGVPDLEGLRQFLMATIGWSRERTDEVLVPVIKDMNKRDVEGTQANITRFFTGGVGAGAKEAFAPRQRAQGSKRMMAAVDRLRSNVVSEPSTSNSNEAAPAKRKRNARQTVDDDEDDGEPDGDAANVGQSNGRKKGKKAKKTG